MVAHNDQSYLPYTAPTWFRKVTTDPLYVNAVATALDFHNGSQRATPTCEPALEQVRLPCLAPFSSLPDPYLTPCVGPHWSRCVVPVWPLSRPYMTPI